MAVEKTERRLGFALPVLIYVGIFAMCCCVLVTVFAGAKTMGRRAELENNAVQLCRNAAEVYRASGDMVQVNNVLAHGGALAFDRDLKPCGAADAMLLLEMSESAEENGVGALRTLTLRATDATGEELYHLNVQFYAPEGRG